MHMIRRLMLDYRCGHYEGATSIYHLSIAHFATKWWREHAATEDEKMKIEEFENNSQGKDPIYILKKAGCSQIEINVIVEKVWNWTNRNYDWEDKFEDEQ